MYFTKGYTVLLFLCFFFLVILLCVFATQGYMTGSLEEANLTRQEIETRRPRNTATSIFINNFVLTVPLVAPLIGIVPFLVVWHNTGVVVGLLSKAYGVHPVNYVLSLAVLGGIEILAYTFALAENVYVSTLALTRSGAKQRIIMDSWRTAILYLVFLLVGAIVEVILIGAAT